MIINLLMLAVGCVVCYYSAKLGTHLGRKYNDRSQRED